MKTAKSFLIYAFTLFFNALISFATFSLLTRHLSEVDYGVINLYNSFTIFLVPFLSIGVPFTLSVDYFKMDETSYRSHFTNGLAIPVLSSAIFTILFLLFVTPVSHLLKINNLFTLLLPASCLLIVLNEITLNTIRNKGHHFLFATYSIVRNLAEIGLTVLFVLGLGMKWEGRLLSAFLALGLGAIVIIILVVRWHYYTASFSKSDIKNIFKIGLPFIPERLAIFVLAYSDRFFIDYYRGTGEVGFYGAGAQLAMIVNLTTLTLNNTFYPVIYKKLTEKNPDYKGIKKITIVYIGLAAATSLGVILFTPFIFKHFVGAVFLPGKKYAILLTIGFFFWSVYNVFFAYLLNSKLNKTIMIISVIGMACSIILNLINVKIFGAIGATYTSIIVYFLMAALVIYFVHRHYNLAKIFAKRSVSQV